MENLTQVPLEPQVVTLENKVLAAAAIEHTAEQMIPKHRFDEVYAQMKTLKEQMDTMNATKAEQERKELEATNQFKALYEQTNTEYEQYKQSAATYEAKATQYESVINGMVESKLTTLPEDYHDLIPANLTAVEKLDWLNKAEAKGIFKAKETVGKTPIGQPINVPHLTPDLTKCSPQDLLQMAYSQSK